MFTAQTHCREYSSIPGVSLDLNNIDNKLCQDVTPNTVQSRYDFWCFTKVKNSSVRYICNGFCNIKFRIHWDPVGGSSIHITCIEIKFFLDQQIWHNKLAIRLSDSSTVKDLKKLRISLNDFEVKNIIGRGHFGEVQVVREKHTGDVYALKVLRKADTLAQQNVTIKLFIWGNQESKWSTQSQGVNLTCAMRCTYIHLKSYVLNSHTRYIFGS